MSSPATPRPPRPVWAPSEAGRHEVGPWLLFRDRDLWLAVAGYHLPALAAGIASVALAPGAPVGLLALAEGAMLGFLSGLCGAVASLLAGLLCVTRAGLFGMQPPSPWQALVARAAYLTRVELLWLTTVSLGTTAASLPLWWLLERLTGMTPKVVIHTIRIDGRLALLQDLVTTGEGRTSLALLLASLAVVCWVGLRLSLLRAIAMIEGRPYRQVLPAAWTRSRGHVWALLQIYAATALPGWSLLWLLAPPVEGASLAVGVWRVCHLCGVFALGASLTVDFTAYYVARVHRAAGKEPGPGSATPAAPGAPRATLDEGAKGA